MNNNPLLCHSFDLPVFDQIMVEQIQPAIDTCLQVCYETVQRVLNNPDSPTWENTLLPIENATESLNYAWGIVNHLHHVCDTPALRNVFHEVQPLVTQFFTAFGQNIALFHRIQRIKTSPDFAAYSPARKKSIDNTMLDFTLSGAELSEDSKVRFTQIEEKLAQLTTHYAENVLDAMNHYALCVEKDEESRLTGIPPDVLAAAAAKAQAAGRTGYMFGLQFSTYLPFLQYVEDASLRATLYRAYVTKASELGDNPLWDNTALIDEIVQLREERAHLLGYSHYAQTSLATKMADSTETVRVFLYDLLKRIKPYAEQDVKDLHEFASLHLGHDTLCIHDIFYVTEKLRQHRFAYSEQTVKAYFSVHKVKEGLFQLISQLYGITIKQDVAPTWHPDVAFYRIENNGSLVGQFYFDLYARDNKQNGAWVDVLRNRRYFPETNTVQTPVAYVVCNFTPLDAQQETYLTHEEVITLFHEMGHAMHHLLTRVDEVSVAGFSGVEWDAVELPSQFMENFCWEWAVVQQITSHRETGLPLPRDLYDKMIAAKNFQAGLGVLRQIEYALFDLHLHDGTLIEQNISVQALLDGIRKEVAVLQPPEFNRFQHAFTHIFSGGYAAGYYSYLWAEVLSADVYAAFEEAGDLSAMGRKFQEEILAVGGTRGALASFIAFRGRKPMMDAFLNHHGIAPPVSVTS